MSSWSGIRRRKVDAAWAAFLLSPTVKLSLNLNFDHTLLTFIVSKLKVVVEGGEEVVGELPVEVVQVFRAIPAALQTKCEVVRHRACEVWVPERRESFWVKIISAKNYAIFMLSCGEVPTTFDQMVCRTEVCNHLPPCNS